MVVMKSHAEFAKYRTRTNESSLPSPGSLSFAVDPSKIFNGSRHDIVEPSTPPAKVSSLSSFTANSATSKNSMVEQGSPVLDENKQRPTGNDDRQRTAQDDRQSPPTSPGHSRHVDSHALDSKSTSPASRGASGTKAGHVKRMLLLYDSNKRTSPP
mmetsp:Transcript_30204/g.48773  ORF Transcript_30204/g.48773 Transcript_30204/m.48773 type:complete len:156 (+) Transcript_30204:1304-1771(+)